MQFYHAHFARFCDTLSVHPENSNCICLAGVRIKNTGSLISREYLHKGGNYNIIESR